CISIFNYFLDLLKTHNYNQHKKFITFVNCDAEEKIMKKIIILAASLLIVAIAGNIVLYNAYKNQKKNVDEYSTKLKNLDSQLQETKKQLDEETQKRQQFADVCQTLQNQNEKLLEKINALQSPKKNKSSSSAAKKSQPRKKTKSTRR
ncbi:MAG TPA: hypothetical protein PLJ38_02470, partial [bacterium]|nr:hypothetical protein [bacterium]